MVTIPLPGTNAWMGALVAATLNMRLQSALPAMASESGFWHGCTVPQREPTALNGIGGIYIFSCTLRETVPQNRIGRSPSAFAMRMRSSTSRCGSKGLGCFPTSKTRLSGQRRKVGLEHLWEQMPCLHKTCIVFHRAVCMGPPPPKHNRR